MPSAEVGNLIGRVFWVARRRSIRVFASRDPRQPTTWPHHTLKHGGELHDGSALDVLGDHAVGGKLIGVVANVETSAAHQEENRAIIVVLAKSNVPEKGTIDILHKIICKLNCNKTQKITRFAISLCLPISATFSTSQDHPTFRTIFMTHEFTVV